MNEYTPPILIKDLGMKLTANTLKKKRFGLYKCFCGQEFEAYTNNVAIGGTKSCGCLRKNRGKKLKIKQAGKQDVIEGEIA